MSPKPTKSKRERAFSIFVAAFFLAVIWAMVAANVAAQGDWTIGKIISANAGLGVATLVGLIAAVVYYRRGQRP